MINKPDPKPKGEILPVNAIRVETVLSRFPIHRLSKQGSIKIDLTEENERGEATLEWKVSYSSEYKQPGPLAYKLDTLIINRRIEEAPARKVPRMLRLGSLSDICKELGLADSGKNRTDIKNALIQNAAAIIHPKLKYTQANGEETTLETVFSRYSVILTGKKLPNGKKADGIYVILNDVFLQVINGAKTRPLDYDYLKSLSPTQQRFYELLSYQMYAALLNDRPRARLTYSVFCAHAPQKRHAEWKLVRIQMNRIHRKHLESGYIADIDIQETVDNEGTPDWIMHYRPGPKARAEFRAFQKQGGPRELEIEPLEPEAAVPCLEAGLDPRASRLAAELVNRGISQKSAAELLRQRPAEYIKSKIEVFDWLMEQPEPPLKPAGFLYDSIRKDYSVPPDFIPKAERQRRKEAEEQRIRDAAENDRRERERRARDRAERKAIATYWASLTPDQQAAHDAAAVAQADAEERKLIEPGPMQRIGMGILRDNYTRRLLQAQGKLPTAKA